jgi:prevent-host-death family protein
MCFKLEHMRVATVRDLRNRYTDLLDWIAAGEEVLITRRGTTVARLVPANPEPKAVDWTQSAAFKRHREEGGRVLTAEESRAILEESSGKW